MEKRFQVFVSSTFEDLQQERQEVMHALLELDCIPSGMELFPAANEDQWTLIKRVIDDCDYYVVIIAGRYGSVDDDGMSYTEKEYRYALEKDRPIVAFLHKNIEELPAKLLDKDQEKRQKLQEFRAFAEKKAVKYWTSSAELGSVVSRSLIRLMKTHAAIGWVRGDEVPDESTSKEILKLRRRIEELEAELNVAGTEAPPGTEDLSQGEDQVEVSFNFKATANYRSEQYEGSFDTTWNEIFYVISPILINEASESDMKRELNRLVQEKRYKVVKTQLPNKSISYLTISDSSFQMIKVQLRALGLIDKSTRPRSLKDTQTYWKLTPYGDSHMNKLRAIRRPTEPSPAS